VVNVSSLADSAGKHPQTQVAEKSDVARKQVAQILAALAPCGMDEDVDAACRDAFEVCQGGKVAWGLIRYAARCGATVGIPDQLCVARSLERVR
jgi:hypothetical protein